MNSDAFETVRRTWDNLALFLFVIAALVGIVAVFATVKYFQDKNINWWGDEGLRKRAVTLWVISASCLILFGCMR